MPPITSRSRVACCRTIERVAYLAIALEISSNEVVA
jgi:hypothetical protein